MSYGARAFSNTACISGGGKRYAGLYSRCSPSMRTCLFPDTISTPSLAMYLTERFVPGSTATGFESSSALSGSAVFIWPQAAAAKTQSTAQIFVALFMAMVIRATGEFWFRRSKTAGATTRCESPRVSKGDMHNVVGILRLPPGGCDIHDVEHIALAYARAFAPLCLARAMKIIDLLNAMVIEVTLTTTI